MNIPVVVGGGAGGILLVLLYVAFQLLGGCLSFADWGRPRDRPVGAKTSDAYQDREVFASNVS
jgi:hypothetical protein